MDVKPGPASGATQIAWKMQSSDGNQIERKGTLPSPFCQTYSRRCTVSQTTGMDVIQAALSLLCEYLCANCLTINIGAVIAFILMQVMCLTEMATLSELASHLIVIVIKETMITLITSVKIVPHPDTSLCKLQRTFHISPCYSHNSLRQVLSTPFYNLKKGGSYTRFIHFISKIKIVSKYPI